VNTTLNWALLCRDSEIRESYVAGMCLQTDKAWVRINARRIPQDGIGGAAPEPSRFPGR
jgi:hypothetical protein